MNAGYLGLLFQCEDHDLRNFVSEMRSRLRLCFQLLKSQAAFHSGWYVILYVLTEF